MSVTLKPWNKGVAVELSEAGDISDPVFVNADEAVITAIPGSGGSMLVEATWSHPLDVLAGGGNWFPWDLGTDGEVDEASNQLLIAATAVRFTAIDQPGTGEVAR